MTLSDLARMAPLASAIAFRIQKVWAETEGAASGDLTTERSIISKGRRRHCREAGRPCRSALP